MPVKSYIKICQTLLWSLTVVSFLLLLRQSKFSPQTYDVLHVTISDVKIGIGFQIDILSTLLLFMISSLGAAIGNYSVRYLDGESKQSYFFKYLMGTVLSAALLVLSSNMLMFFSMWLGISYNLHRLLVYYKERPQAIVAARKKAIISRFGDLILLIAIVLTYQIFGSFEFTDIFSQVGGRLLDQDSQLMMSWIGVLITIGALTKSAQIPFHFWLPDTMETPTPVSALMHAGVINAGGILIIRMSPLLQDNLAAHILLTFVGTVSAVFGALCMIVQNDIKKKLAYSTISQMGMMMLACGLGAYSLALFHIFAHSFYKAYAFLSTGMLVEDSKKLELKMKAPSISATIFAGIFGLSTIVFAGLYDSGQYLPYVTYASILSLGLFQNFFSLEHSKVRHFEILSKILGTLASAIIVYSAIEMILVYHMILITPQSMSFDIYVRLVLSVASFAMFWFALVLSARLFNINTPWLEKTYIYLRNGGYLSIKSSMILSRFYPSTTTSR